MSVNYIVKERISIKNYPNDYVLSAIVDTLVDIGREMLYDRAVIEQLSLTVNGKSYSYQGNEITHDFHEIIRAIDGAHDLELILAYNGGCYYFPIAESVKNTLEDDPESADHIFYCLYNQADCDSGVGILSALGKKNGVYYDGVIEPQTCPNIPTAQWESADTVIAFEEEITDGMDTDEIAKCAAELSALGSEMQFEMQDGTAVLYVNRILLDSAEKTEKFIEICSRLHRATNGTCGFLAEFVDMSKDNAQTMIIDFDERGEYVVKLARIG